MFKRSKSHLLIKRLIYEVMRLDPDGVALAALSRLGDMAESDADWDSHEAAELRDRLLAAKLPQHIVDDAVDAACETHTYIEQLRLMDMEDDASIESTLDELDELLDGLEEMLA